MTKVVYEVVEHDGGWAYKQGDVFSEPFGSKEDAVSAADDAAARQELPGSFEAIEYQDKDGDWHQEDVHGDQRPDTTVDTKDIGS